MINNKQNISHYINARLKSNHDLNNHQHKYGNNIQQSIFYLLYFVIGHALDEGDTVLVLKNQTLDDKTYKTWQAAIIEPTVNYLSNYLTDDFNIDVIFKKIDEHKNDDGFLKEYINDVQKSLRESYDKSLLLNPVRYDTNSVMHANIKHELCNILLWLLRFYFYGQHKLMGDLEKFVDSLDYQRFFTQDPKYDDKPIVVCFGNGKFYFWLGRIYKSEKFLLTQLQQISQTSVTPIALGNVSDLLNDEQKNALNIIAYHAFSLITGGPGTGKTFTIAQIVKAIYQTSALTKDTPKLALVAPTGKAAQRMAESLQNALQEKHDFQLPEPMTIHRLLGIGMQGVPHFNKANPLPYEMIIVDEASMLGVELAMLLFMAVKRGARIILLGDAHQLSAVDAGAVLADLCRLPMFTHSLVELTQSKRFNHDSGIGRLARLVNDRQQTHDIENVMKVIHEEANLSFTDIKKSNTSSLALDEFYQILVQPYQTDGQTISFFTLTKSLKFKFYRQNDIEKQHSVQKLMDAFNQYRILTASHLSHWGDHKINDYIRHAHREFLGLPPMQAHYSPWYHGRVVMVLKNRYDLGLYNGDIGICLQSGDKANELSVYFLAKELKVFSVSLLDDNMIATAYAMTIHKSQGSEFDNVAVVFHEDNSRLLSKELIYTAITRAKKSVSIYSSEKALIQAINQPTIRQTGLTL